MCDCLELPVTVKHFIALYMLPAGAAPAARALQLSLSVGKTNLLLRNLLRTPILELEAAKINLGEHRGLCS